MIWDLVEKLETLKPELNNKVEPTQLTARLRRTVRDLEQVRVMTKRDPGLDPNTVAFGGHHDQESDEIQIHVYTTQHSDTIDINKLDWSRVCLEFAECLGHELVHRQQQTRARPPGNVYRSKETDAEKKRDQEYLGTAEEIEAYGYSIAAELAVKHRVFVPDPVLLDQIVMYQVYVNTFDTDQSVVLKLHRQISKYLHRLEVDYNDKTNNTSRRPNRSSRD